MGLAIQNGIWVNVPLPTWGTVKGKGYKIGSEKAHLLIRRGWTRSPGGRGYAYMMPPPGVVPPFRISVEVPTHAQVLDIAGRLHESSVEWWGHVGEWLAHYKPWNPGGQVGPFSAYLSVGWAGVWGITVWFEEPEPNVVVFDDGVIVLAVNPGVKTLNPSLTGNREPIQDSSLEVTNDGR